MYPDLVGTPGLKLQEQQGVARVALLDAKMGARLATIDRGNGHLLTVARIATNGGVDTPLVQRDNARDQGEIAFHYLVALHLFDHSDLRMRVLRHDEQAGGVAVQPMHDAWPYVFLHT